MSDTCGFGFSSLLFRTDANTFWFICATDYNDFMNIVILEIECTVLSCLHFKAQTAFGFCRFVFEQEICLQTPVLIQSNVA